MFSVCYASATSYYLEMNKALGERIPVILVANKSDIEHKKENVDAINLLAKSMETDVVFTSALTGANVDNVFQGIMEKSLASLKSQAEALKTSIQAASASIKLGATKEAKQPAVGKEKSGKTSKRKCGCSIG